MNKEPFVITRHSEPNNLDTAERGTVCHVNEYVGENSFYVQMSSNAESPTWIRLESKTLDDAQRELISLISS